MNSNNSITSNNTRTAGDVVVAPHAFTTPIGASFAKGDRFTVEAVGLNIKLRAYHCGSVVWLVRRGEGWAFLEAGDKVGDLVGRYFNGVYITR